MRYYRNVGVVILALAILLFGGVYAMPNEPRQLTITNTIIQAPSTTPEDSVVMVNLEGGHGSGVHLGNGIILTAAHVADGSKPIKLKTSDGKEMDAEFLWANKTYDIALLRTDGKIAGQSSLDCRTVKLGDEIQAAGNPLSIEFVSSFGRVAGGVREAGPWKRVFMTDITTVMGMSGGPVFEPDGRVIGVVVGAALAPLQAEKDGPFTPSLSGIGMAVPSATVCMLLGMAS